MIAAMVRSVLFAVACGAMTFAVSNLVYQYVRLGGGFVRLVFF
jgi:hypothetical protein